MDLLKLASCTALLSLACVPELDTDDSTVAEAKVLAIQAEPAEAAPGESVSYRALFVNRAGGNARGRLTWFHCEARKPVAELGPVSQECFDDESGKLVRIGAGAEVEGMMPVRACSLFGPNPPAPEEDGPPGRPADPDATGGYKLPVILGVVRDEGEGRAVLYEQRISCGLAGVTTEISGEFNRRYRRNGNPAINQIHVTRKGADPQLLAEGQAIELSPGEVVDLDARWPSCPEVDSCGDGVCGISETLAACPGDCTTPVGCPGQEDYLWFDVEARELISRRESLSLAWYATDGTFRDERTGVDEDKRATGSQNQWTAPNRAGEAALWIVLRDSRGGVGFEELKVSVR